MPDTPGDIAAALRAALADLPVESLRQARSTAEDSGSAVHGVTAGTNHPGPARMSAAFGEICEAIDRALAEFDHAARAIEEYNAILTGSGGAATDTGGGQANGSPTPSLADITTRSEPLAAIRRAGEALPVRAAGDKTHGSLLTVGGKTITDDTFTTKNGQLRSDELPSSRDGLDPRWHPTSPMFNHAEGHAAAMLRKPGAPKEAILVINNEPCVGRGRMRGKGCDDMLEGAMPAGTKLAVYLNTDGQQTTLYKVYTGTGEGIKA
ncbi:DddA-like double-stranded DNA deaminase toxin [Phytomonospora endophytica]|uniref:Nucleic acid/nucleotide deaminase of polymorphic system toxin n=1 Tax=Phytomonospora endophytica TaxID=714109 RepID=A0A841FQV5_9ACTN|nr:DddA-like double-stranded DNA deaminase toxin [Phytomonospora endophytica]MBB6038214.1 hypothetical protein [Phytomonospora endophytica]GIG67328.1 hypothetical protein Pen01_36230 [Phytomonospora endophytica]